MKHSFHPVVVTLKSEHCCVCNKSFAGVMKKAMRCLGMWEGGEWNEEVIGTRREGSEKMGAWVVAKVYCRSEI